MTILSDLKPNPKNPRTISDEKLKALEKTISEFGDLSGFVYNRRTKRLVGGHQRAKVLPPDAKVNVTKLYESPTKRGTVASGFLSFKGERFSYREVDWPELKEKAANLAANKGGGEWDLDMVGEWMRELDGSDFDLDLTLFDESERQDFLADPVADAEKSESENRFPEKPPVRSKKGDLFLLGNHRLICGDSTSQADLKRLMRDEKADLVFTSPPYNGNTTLTYGKRQGALYRDNETDNKTSEEYLAFNQTIFEGFKRVLKPDANVFYNIGYNKKSRSEWVRIVLNAIEQGFSLFETIVWKKNAAPNSAPDVMTRNFEFIFLFSQAETYRSNKVQSEGFSSNFWDIQNNGSQTEEHAACFPVGLPEKAILDTTKEGDLVFEPFGGSGTTMIAAEKTKRRCFMVELDPKYCDTILARWEFYTGEKAKLVKRTKT